MVNRVGRSEMVKEQESVDRCGAAANDEGKYVVSAIIMISSTLISLALFAYDTLAEDEGE